MADCFRRSSSIENAQYQKRIRIRLVVQMNDWSMVRYRPLSPAGGPLGAGRFRGGAPCYKPLSSGMWRDLPFREGASQAVTHRTTEHESVIAKLLPDGSMDEGCMRRFMSSRWRTGSLSVEAGICKPRGAQRSAGGLFFTIWGSASSNPRAVELLGVLAFPWQRHGGTVEIGRGHRHPTLQLRFGIFDDATG